MATLVYEVISRYFFSSPTLWAFDTTYMIYGAHFMLVAAFALARPDHIRTDFVSRMAPVPWQAGPGAALYLLFFLPARPLLRWGSTESPVDPWHQDEARELRQHGRACRRK